MLAMLSCVLQRSSKATATLSEDDSKESDSRQHSGLPSYHPLALAERYFPSAEVASSILRPPATRPSFSFDMQKPISGPHSAASSVGATNSDPLTPYSTGLTPPTPLKIPKSKQQRTILHTPMSTSPEQLKHVHRSSSNLASTFAASIARPFSFGTPESSSPPTLHPKPRLSPAPSQLSTMNPNFTAVPSTLSRQASANARGPKPRITPPASDGHHGVPGEGAFETKLKNQDQFHNDGYAAESLLDPSKEEAYSAYRSMYASMLLTWELPIASCKVLQYNTSFHTRQNKEDQAEGRSVITIGKHTSGSSAPQGSSDLRLDIYKQCQKCAATLPPGTDTKRCPACSTRQAPALCHLCHSIIVGLSSPCLNCGHALHLSCRSSIDTHLNGECPAACGCICIDHLVVDVNVETPTFPNASERKASMSSATLLHANEREEPGWRAVGEDAEADENEEAWEDVAAYESLARNLGGRRFLTPKPSRVWRGGGGRKGSFPGMMRRAGSEG